MFINAQAINMLVKIYVCPVQLNASNAQVIQTRVALPVKQDLILKMPDVKENVQTIILT